LLESSPEAKILAGTSPAVQELRRELVLRAGKWEEEAAEAKRLIVEEGYVAFRSLMHIASLTARSLLLSDRSWDTLTTLINGAVYTPAPPTPESIPFLDPGLPISAPPPSWPVPADVTADQRAAIQEKAKDVVAVRLFGVVLHLHLTV
jgi:hypothetical protein